VTLQDPSITGRTCGRSISTSLVVSRSIASSCALDVPCQLGERSVAARRLAVCAGAGGTTFATRQPLASGSMLVGHLRMRESGIPTIVRGNRLTHTMLLAGF
jgi:hypothetical protein